ncbi:ABC transporter ATP-binding protein [Motiliproteus sp. MSK22-1]|uniref:ABC transporter ATP-binding protein n=1 Tax=Motiliproteus sp. MSK22-1 TaxID=1897630 RepID=UPI0009789EDC|nr:ABC transporter ATP-binding protein [Motiliproteus sp. MSK22-1]OMH25813.1 histidinol phosphatase [Motiliproteus sp. MSK22-1]
MGRIVVDRLNWAPQGRKKLLEDICLTAEPGSFTGIVGPNGSGKSSLLRCIYRVNRPHSGIVTLQGRDLWKMNIRESAQSIAVVLQESSTDFNLDVRQVLDMGRTPHKRLFERDSRQDRKIVEDVLDRLSLRELARRPFAALSGGEKQRVLLARALVQSPSVLILDEPTNHLDIRHQLELLNLIQQLDITVIATIHDLNIAAHYCDRIYLMNQGRIQAQGTAEEVLRPQPLAEVFQVQTHVDKHPESNKPRLSFHIPKPTTALKGK